ncbi:polypyrimidine tract-binding protein homolog 2 isoform X4 [Tanacetum coccineum]
MPISKETMDGDFKTASFEESPLMTTYLVDVVGFFDYIKETTSDVVPDFSGGTMENYGLITYREAELLHDDLHSAVENTQRMWVCCKFGIVNAFSTDDLLPCNGNVNIPSLSSLNVSSIVAWRLANLLGHVVPFSSLVLIWGAASLEVLFCGSASYFFNKWKDGLYVTGIFHWNYSKIEEGKKMMVDDNRYVFEETELGYYNSRGEWECEERWEEEKECLGRIDGGSKITRCSGRVKDYVIECIGSEIKQRPKSEWILEKKKSKKAVGCRWMRKRIQPQFRYTQTPSKVLHLRNLPWKCTEEELIELGKPFGKVVNTKCNVGANRNQAFIEFFEQNQAITMISYYASSSEPAQVHGKTVYLQYSNRQEIVNNKTSADVAGNVLLVTIEGNDARSVSIDVLHLVSATIEFVVGIQKMYYDSAKSHFNMLTPSVSERDQQLQSFMGHEDEEKHKMLIPFFGDVHFSFMKQCGSPMSEFQLANLLSWAHHLARARKLIDLVDHSIQDLDKEQALVCITVALLCLKKPALQPSMKEIVAMLSGDL